MDNNPIIIQPMDIPALPALNSFCLSWHTSDRMYHSHFKSPLTQPTVVKFFIRLPCSLVILPPPFILNTARVNFKSYARSLPWLNIGTVFSRTLNKIVALPAGILKASALSPRGHGLIFVLFTATVFPCALHMG